MSKRKKKRSNKSKQGPIPTALALRTDLVPISDLGVTDLEVKNNGAKAKIPPERLIKGPVASYGIVGGKIYDLALGQQPPMLAGMVQYEVPLDKEEIIKAFVWGWEEAEKEVEDIYKGAGDISSKARAIEGLLHEHSTHLIYEPSIQGQTAYAHDQGAKMGIHFTMLRHPDVMLYRPKGGIFGREGQQKDVVSQMEARELPYGN